MLKFLFLSLIFSIILFIHLAVTVFQFPVSTKILNSFPKLIIRRERERMLRRAELMLREASGETKSQRCEIRVCTVRFVFFFYIFFFHLEKNVTNDVEIVHSRARAALEVRSPSCWRLRSFRRCLMMWIVR